MMLDDVPFVRPDMRLLGLALPFTRLPLAGMRIGLLDRVLARLSRLESELSLSSLVFSSAIVSGCGDFGLDFERVK